MDINTINEVACNLVKVSNGPESNIKFNFKKVKKSLYGIKVIPLTWFCEINYMTRRK
jgi:hypothetical protein